MPTGGIVLDDVSLFSTPFIRVTAVREEESWVSIVSFLMKHSNSNVNSKNWL